MGQKINIKDVIAKRISDSFSDKSPVDDNIEKAIRDTTHLRLVSYTDKNGKKNKHWVHFDNPDKKDMELESPVIFEHKGHLRQGIVKRVAPNGQYGIQHEGELIHKNPHQVKPASNPVLKPVANALPKDMTVLPKEDDGFNIGDSVELYNGLSLISLSDLKGKKLKVIDKVKTGLISQPIFIKVEDEKGEEFELNPDHIRLYKEETITPVTVEEAEKFKVKTDVEKIGRTSERRTLTINGIKIATAAKYNEMFCKIKGGAPSNIRTESKVAREFRWDFEGIRKLMKTDNIKSYKNPLFKNSYPDTTWGDTGGWYSSKEIVERLVAAAKELEPIVPVEEEPIEDVEVVEQNPVNETEFKNLGITKSGKIIYNTDASNEVFANYNRQDHIDAFNKLTDWNYSDEAKTHYNKALTMPEVSEHSDETTKEKEINRKKLSKELDELKKRAKKELTPAEQSHLWVDSDHSFYDAKVLQVEINVYKHALSNDVEKALDNLFSTEEDNIEKAKKALDGEIRRRKDGDWVKHNDGWVHLHNKTGKYSLWNDGKKKDVGKNHIEFHKKIITESSGKENPTDIKQKKVEEIPPKKVQKEKVSNAKNHNLAGFDYGLSQKEYVDYLNSIEQEIEKHKEKTNQKLWSSELEGSEAGRAILEKVRKTLKTENLDKYRNHGVLKDLKKIRFSIGNLTSGNSYGNRYSIHEDTIKEKTNNTQRIIRAADLLSQPIATKGLKKLNDLFADDGKDTWLSIESHDVHTNDGKIGTFDLTISGNDARLSLRFIITPDSLHLTNLESLNERLNGDWKFSNSNKNIYAKLLEKVNKSFDYGGKVEKKTFNQESKTKALNIVNNVPPSTSVNRYQGCDVNNEQGTVTLYIDTSRHARHPDEYGEAGTNAVRMDDKWNQELEQKVVGPLEKLGYHVQRQARR